MIAFTGALLFMNLSIFSFMSNTTEIVIISAMAKKYVPRNLTMIYLSSLFIHLPRVNQSFCGLIFFREFVSLFLKLSFFFSWNSEFNLFFGVLPLLNQIFIRNVL